MTFFDLFKKVRQNLVVFVIFLALFFTFFGYQLHLVNQKFMVMYGNYDTRTYYNYSQTFTFNFPEGEEVKSAYDKYTKVATLEPLATLSAFLKGEEVCREIMGGLSQDDLRELNVDFVNPRYVINEKSCVAPIDVTTRDYDLNVKSFNPVSFELAKKIGEIATKTVEEKAKTITPEPTIALKYASEALTPNERSTASAVHFREVAEYVLIAILLSFSLTALFSHFSEISRWIKTANNAKTFIKPTKKHPIPNIHILG